MSGMPGCLECITVVIYLEEIVKELAYLSPQLLEGKSYEDNTDLSEPHD